jgi:hypothetical protein
MTSGQFTSYAWAAPLSETLRWVSSPKQANQRCWLRHWYRGRQPGLPGANGYAILDLLPR